MIKKERIHELTPGREGGGNVVYWMSREQRIRDNPGLLFARHLAARANSQLLVVFTLSDTFPGAAWRHYDFMLKGLQQVAEGLSEMNIPFYLLQGHPPEAIERFLGEGEVATVVVDFDPLKIKRQWVSSAISKTTARYVEVDGHNIVPARFVSDKAEYGAYTLRPKIHRLLGDFLEVFPEPEPQQTGVALPGIFSPGLLLKELRVDRSVKPVDWIKPGEMQAHKALLEFIEEGLSSYHENRNNPNLQGTSRLSPFLHFGQISSQRVAIEVIKGSQEGPGREAFLEELIIRKELSDNFCFYQPDYDNPGGFHPWAQKTHAEHEKDEREHIYSTSEFERGETHDSLWNAAQMEMVNTGRMHGYMRMYWAKKILEWTENRSRAMEVAVYLNDKYELDGRDPNGYAGIAWSIGGVHDRAWTERPVFGKIRYMNYNGCKRKFNVSEYIRTNNGTAQQDLFA